MIRILRTTFGLLSRRARWQLAGLMLLAASNAVFEVVGAVVVLSLVTLLASPERAASLGLVSVLGDLFGIGDSGTMILALCAFMAGFYVIKNGLLTFEAYAQSRFAFATTVDLSTALLRGYLSSDYTLHLRRNSATLIHAIEDGVTRFCGSILLSTTVAVSQCLNIAAMVAVLLVKAPFVALAAGFVLTLGLAKGLRTLLKAFERWGGESHGLEIASRQLLHQSLDGIKEIKVLGREDYFAERYAAKRAGRSRYQMLRAMVAVVPRLLVETVFVIGIAGYVFVAVSEGTTREVVPILGLLVYAGFRILPMAHRAVYHFNNIQFDMPSIVRLAEDLEVGRALEAARRVDASAAREPFSGCVVFEHVTFAYASERRPALYDVDLAISVGESIGIVGPTGSGKSTLVDLFLGLLRPTSGRVTVDDLDLAESTQGWQQQIGYVPQTIYLADDTLRRNVAFGIPDEAIDEERVRRAVRLAQLERFVDNLPEGLDTVVGERGVRLSGGERQRVAIARALYGEPRVMVFDEATAALDNRTEREVTRAIEQLRGDRTLVLVAHRLSTVRRCDRLLFVRNGRIEDVGSYDDLLERNGAFRALALADDVEHAEASPAPLPE